MQVPQIEITVRRADGAVLLQKTVPPGDYVLGRAPDVDLSFEADLVSRRHAQLTINFDHAFIQDLGSSNGTLVNGQPVTEVTRLWPNQKIQVGAATVELRRVKTMQPPDVSLAPAEAAVQRLLPEELLRERKYAIGKVVAQGGMGAILNAKDAATERTVAMKVMLDGSSPDALVRFVAEARVTAQLEHPNIVPVHELSVDENGQPYYTMKMVRGITLRKVLELLAKGVPETARKYPLPALLTIFQKACDALAFAHSKGVIHRDLKPENLMLDDFGVVLVMDWGLAKVIGKKEAPPGAGERSGIHTLPSEASGATLDGTIMGTPAFMSPEQARGEVENLDPRSDIYALGAILFQILHLRPPCSGRGVGEIVDKVQRGEVAWPDAKSGASQKLPHLPGGNVPDSLSAVCKKALAFERDQRYSSIEEFQRDLAAYQAGFATSAEKAGAWKQIGLLVKRHKAVTTSIAAALVFIVALSTGFTLELLAGEREARRNAQVATENEKRANSTLKRLRGTAPTFAEQAQALLDKQKFAAALEKIDYAIELDPAESQYHYLQGNLFEDLGHLGDARDAYNRALQRNPGYTLARENRDLCDQLLLTEAFHTELSKPSLAKLNALMRQEDRAAEALGAIRMLGKDRKALLETWQKVFQKAGLPTDFRRFSLSEDGFFDIDLGGQQNLDDISALSGMPMRKLNLGFTKVTDLRPLAGTPLECLDISHTAVADLRPLSGTRLNSLILNDAPIADLTPLRGLPLESLSAVRCANLTDVNALRGLPLKRLNIGSSPVQEIRALHGMPLIALDISSTKVKDFSPIAGMHLTDLSCREFKNLELLRGMPLETLNLTRSAFKDLRILRGMPLKKLNLSGSLVEDASALSGMRLTEFDPPSNSIDLSPVRGQPIERAGFNSSDIADFSILSTWPLTYLSIVDTLGFSDLNVLRGKLLTHLDLTGSRNVRDITPLRGMPLRELLLRGTGVTDLHPVADLPELEELVIPPEVTDIEFLRRLPSIKRLDTNGGQSIAVTPAVEFWKQYDARRKGPPK